MLYRPTSRAWPLLALGACLLRSGMASAQAPPPRLTGRWTLNLELSEQIESKLSDALRLGAFGNRRPAAAGNGASKDQPVDARELLGSLRPAFVLVIRQDDSTVAISDAGGFMVAFPTDGRKVKEYLLSGETLEVSARWKDGQLIIERQQERAGSVRETYAVDQPRGKLVVTLRLRTPALPRQIESRRVYDLTPES